MSATLPNTVIGCLVGVSGSMRDALEAGRANEPSTERLVAVLRAILEAARIEFNRNSSAMMFVGAFGLNPEARCPTVVDLYGLVSALLALRKEDSNTGSSHDRLVQLAADRNRLYIEKYIRRKLAPDEALILHNYLQQNPDRFQDFVEAIPVIFYT